MENYKINADTVTTKTEALYWISKIWYENSHKLKDEKELLTEKVLDLLVSNVIDTVS